MTSHIFETIPSLRCIKQLGYYGVSTPCEHLTESSLHFSTLCSEFVSAPGGWGGGEAGRPTIITTASFASTGGRSFSFVHHKAKIHSSFTNQNRFINRSGSWKSVTSGRLVPRFHVPLSQPAVLLAVTGSGGTIVHKAFWDSRSYLFSLISAPPLFQLHSRGQPGGL